MSPREIAPAELLEAYVLDERPLSEEELRYLKTSLDELVDALDERGDRELMNRAKTLRSAVKADLSES